jgi:citrate synthase
VSEILDVREGLDGVVAFRTEIAEPDRDGGALRYRGIDIEELVGAVPFEQVWGLLVEETLDPGLTPVAEVPARALSGDAPADMQSALAALSSEWQLGKLIDIADEEAVEDLRSLSAVAISIAARSARIADGARGEVPAATVASGGTLAERFLLEWRGEADPADAKAIDTYWICTAEHGLNASTFTARVVASTGADAAAALSSAVGALSGPLHGGAPARVLPMLDAVEREGDAERWVQNALDGGERIMGFGHRVYRAEDPRARLLRAAARVSGARRFEVAEALERAVLAELQARKPDRVLATNVEFWSAVVLDSAGVPAPLAPGMFACSRTAGWSAHILEQKRLGKLVRPSAAYVGPAERPLSALRGA